MKIKWIRARKLIKNIEKKIFGSLLGYNFFNF